LANKETNIDAEVIMESDEYGTEVFDYETTDDAIEGFRRLVKSAKKHYKNDGVARKVSLTITVEG